MAKLTPLELAEIHEKLAAHYRAMLTPVADEPTPLIGAPWFAIAKKDVEDGVAEIRGAQDHPRIMQYFKTVRGNWQHDEVPWCSAAVNCWVTEAGVKGTGRANARSWSDWGNSLTSPIVGCVVVLWREDPRSAKGHVGFYAGVDPSDPNRFMLLGGNQGNRVSVKSYPKNRVLSYRWPTRV